MWAEPRVPTSIETAVGPGFPEISGKFSRALLVGWLIEPWGDDWGRNRGDAGVPDVLFSQRITPGEEVGSAGDQVD